jgi:hypothetical protein
MDKVKWEIREEFSISGQEVTALVFSKVIVAL